MTKITLESLSEKTLKRIKQYENEEYNACAAGCREATYFINTENGVGIKVGGKSVISREFTTEEEIKAYFKEEDDFREENRRWLEELRKEMELD